MCVIDFITENWEIISIVFGIVVNLVAIGYNVYRFCRLGKVKSLQNFITLADAARKFEMEAEAFQGYSAAEKLNYVLSRLRTLAAELGCGFNEEEMIATVEADIAFSKVVNAKPSEVLD